MSRHQNVGQPIAPRKRLGESTHVPGGTSQPSTEGAQTTTMPEPEVNLKKQNLLRDTKVRLREKLPDATASAVLGILGFVAVFTMTYSCAWGYHWWYDMKECVKRKFENPDTPNLIRHYQKFRTLITYS